jgi:alkylation response protein AidB-like acyl-CoA dehydrogenase
VDGDALLGRVHALRPLLTEIKRPAVTETAPRERPAVRAWIGEAEARLRAARALLYAAVREGWRSACADGDMTAEERTVLRLAAVHAAAAAVDVVAGAQRVAGSTAIFDDHPLERLARDVRTAVQNVALSPDYHHTAGAFFLAVA